MKLLNVLNPWHRSQPPLARYRQQRRGVRLKTWLSAAPVHLTLVAIALLWTLPTAGLWISSLRPAADLSQSGWWTVFQHPFELTQYSLQNYRDVLTAEHMGRAFLNSLMITLPATLIPVAIATLAAYGLAWMRFPGRQMIMVGIVGLLVVPLQMTLIPVLRSYRDLGLVGQFAAVWLAHTGYGLPLGIYLLRNYIGSLPREVLDAAAIDGASHWQTLTKLVVPLSLPAIASFAVFQFLWVWNDFLVALVYLGAANEVAPVTVQLSRLVGSRGQDWHLLTAGAFVTMVVPLAVFFALQRQFVRGILAGSLKG
ncbi:carbohydrate ABC transporter permease [Leptolyngbya sp. CCY15150]|uniref:carbohydrate ABC transporter permease n=1 Tax=Leptolyngbya sp. CCY15150 TaxID=2767772 RepID=UPI00194F3981|nr:carbohydrate ABC transporter permease [Leptolyngbya sp. CCY15150]